MSYETDAVESFSIYLIESWTLPSFYITPSATEINIAYK